MISMCFNSDVVVEESHGIAIPGKQPIVNLIRAPRGGCSTVTSCSPTCGTRKNAKACEASVPPSVNSSITTHQESPAEQQGVVEDTLGAEFAHDKAHAPDHHLREHVPVRLRVLERRL